MAKLKSKEIGKMSEGDRSNKLIEMRAELVKARAGAQKSGNSRVREIKKIIARILAFTKNTQINNGNRS